MAGKMKDASLARTILAGLGLCLVSSTGCQTWVPEAGVTLPSAYYLEHPPQYIPPSPAFPLPREMKTLKEGYQQPVPDGLP